VVSNAFDALARGRLMTERAGVGTTKRERPLVARPPAGPASSATSDVLLDADAIDFSYGKIQVLFGASLCVPRGGRVALLGPNGAGKSTLLGVISGLLTPSAGTVTFDGGDITSFAAEERAQIGISQVLGGRAILPSMTVEENLWLGAYAFASHRDLVKARLDAVLHVFPPLKTRMRQAAGTLSGGEQQMVALGRALMAGPELLLADELSLGLAPVITETLYRVLEHIVELGTSLLIVEQSVNVALELAEDVYFMEKGETRYLGPASGLDLDAFARSVAMGEAEVS
jgi:branched-chain amino acid transport system ATP-binding protein